MLLERAELQIRPGSEEAFAAALNGRITEILRAVPGVKSVQIGRGVENPDNFIILAEWESLDAHAAFKTLPAYPEFGALIAAHAIGGRMEHFTMG
jgi:heme-degrading monooxygenase HmoA